MSTIKTCLDMPSLPKLECELLLGHVLDLSRAKLRTWPERLISAEQQSTYDALIARRIAGEPIAYILGQRDFWDMTLKVTSDVLIPRHETETLVEAMLARLPEKLPAPILELGVGSGAIILALHRERPLWDCHGVDKSEAALAVAQENVERYGKHQVQLYQSDWFTQVPTQKFSAIVSNPPYIAVADPHLSEGDVRFEPRSALVAEDHGLADYQAIVQQAGDYLTAGGLLCFEHGYEQSPAVQQLLAEQGYIAIETIKDLSGQDRVTIGKWPHE